MSDAILSPPTSRPEPIDEAAGESDRRGGDQGTGESQATGVAFPLLALQGEFLNDLEAVRVANANRVRALRDDLGLADGPEVDAAIALGATFENAEKVVVRELIRALRRDAPGLYEWSRSPAGVGVGEKTLARLLAVIGHPRWRYDNDDESPTYQQWLPRTIAQLWSYCGYAVEGGRAPSRRRGEQARYNTQARVRTFLIAEACVKAVGTDRARRSPFRDVYEEGRGKYAEAVHPVACSRCGPPGRPAEVGSPLSLGHQHARAMRLVAKAVLRELWLAAE